ncbi:MAG: acetyltransferase [Phenylobacterium sp.]|jgi:predicted GNAT family acetyltransferase|nr:acetyltransferase [Phenylobacterium sp.]
MSETGDLQVVNNETEGRFEVRLGDQVAYTEYRLLKTGILFPHTEVPPAFEGQGVGGKLVRAGMAFARERGELVIPVCPFVAAFITRHPEYHDLVHPDYRAALHI